MLHRALKPEILDTLPADHPDALHSRRDLRWINAAMGNQRWFARTLPHLLRPGERALELGAGTGELATVLARHGVSVDGVDFCPPPENWTRKGSWHTGDLRNFPHFADYTAAYGNLIFHHFSDAELVELGLKLRRSVNLILASEPVRSTRSQRLIKFFGRTLGASHVTLHDAHVSIAAGFVGDELPRLLGLEAESWDISCSTTLLGAYRMIARRRI
jgi:SAM-dependent methyltransferase